MKLPLVRRLGSLACGLWLGPLHKAAYNVAAGCRQLGELAESLCNPTGEATSRRFSLILSIKSEAGQGIVQGHGHWKVGSCGCPHGCTPCWVRSEPYRMVLPSLPQVPGWLRHHFILSERAGSHFDGRVTAVCPRTSKCSVTTFLTFLASNSCLIFSLNVVFSVSFINFYPNMPACGLWTSHALPLRFALLCESAVLWLPSGLTFIPGCGSPYQ